MDDRVLRRALARLLGGGGAHATFARALAGLPPRLRTARPEGAERSVWEVVEHMRLAQEDILRWVLEPGWVSPPWPQGYWPARNPERLAAAAWRRSVHGFRSDRARLVALVRDLDVDLTAAVPHRTGVTPLEEVLLVADHNAYHVGQIVAVRRALGAWGG